METIQEVINRYLKGRYANLVKVEIDELDELCTVDCAAAMKMYARTIVEELLYMKKDEWLTVYSDTEDGHGSHEIDTKWVETFLNNLK